MISSTPGQRVGIYLRVSTLNQETENQLLQLRTLYEQRGWRVVKEYVDVANRDVKVNAYAATSPSSLRTLPTAASI